MIEKARLFVEELLKGEDSGHGMEHINRVFDLAMKFAQNEDCNIEIVALGALLHDVDDYKLFGKQSQEQLSNTRAILNQLNVSDNTSEAVIDIIKNMGYSKRLKGICPTTIEGKIVSDADMCDALGASGIIRTQKYSLKYGREFFVKDAFPIDEIVADQYTKKSSDSSVCHFFEKLLKLKGLMLTSSGRKEATKRHDFMVSFLRQVFDEENAPEWHAYLNKYLEKLEKSQTTQSEVNIINFYLEQATEKDKNVLFKLLQYSLFEESETDLNEMNSNAEFDYKYFDKYFTDNDRFAYFIKETISGKLLGFAMINQHTEVVPNGWSIAEFLIIPKYRRLGIGKKVAFELFDKFDGNWEVSPSFGSKKALTFWEKTISEYCNNDFKIVNNLFVFSNLKSE